MSARTALQMGLSAALALAARGSDLRFAPDGLPLELRLGTNAANRVDAQSPGRGFVVRTFTGTSTEDTPLKSVSCRGGQLVVTGERGLPRLTFDLARGERYVALKLKRVEGLPAGG